MSAATSRHCTRADGGPLRVAIKQVPGGKFSTFARGLVPYACKAGVCSTCRVSLITGQVRLVNYGLSKEEVAAGYILTCQAVPQGEGVAVDYDQ